jgi:hypothetical protein
MPILLQPVRFRRLLYALLALTFLFHMMVALWAGIAIWPRHVWLVPFCCLAILVGTALAWTSLRWLFQSNHILLDQQGIRVTAAGESHEFLWREIQRVGFAGGVWPVTATLQLARASPAMRLDARPALFGRWLRRDHSQFVVPPLWRRRDLRTISEMHSRFGGGAPL